jgi:hypothetical protein
VAAPCHHPFVIDTTGEWAQFIVIGSVLALGFGAFIAWVVRENRRG